MGSSRFDDATTKVWRTQPQSRLRSLCGMPLVNSQFGDYQTERYHPVDRQHDGSKMKVEVLFPFHAH
jgi:hypothetical protein